MKLMLVKIPRKSMSTLCCFTIFIEVVTYYSNCLKWPPSSLKQILIFFNRELVTL
jgi:hypothetical protein